MLIQVGYAAVTARLLDPQAFGAYAAAMTTAALVTLVAVVGFSQAAARRLEDDRQGDRRLLGASLLVAGLLGALLFLVASPLAGLWSIPEAASMMRVLALGLPVGAYVGVLSGFLRRESRIRALTWVTWSAGIASVFIGLAAVSLFAVPLALVALPMSTTFLAAVLLARTLPDRARPLLPLRDVREDLAFAMKTAGNSLLIYLSANIPLLMLGRTAGASTLGFWNRATTLVQVPTESLTSSWMTVAFSRFRGPSEGPRERSRHWTDMQVASIVLILPLCGAVGPAVPAGISLILGPGWEITARMGVWIWIASCLTAVLVPLSTVLEATGNFRVLWRVQLARLTVLLAAGGLVLATGDWRPLAMGTALAALAGVMVGIGAAMRSGLLERGTLARPWVVSVFLGGLLAVPGVIADATLRPAGVVAVCGLVTATLLVGLWLLRRRLGPLRAVFGGFS
jgi:O-antigen/teichoic acid export membrane protein